MRRGARSAFVGEVSHLDGGWRAPSATRVMVALEPRSYREAVALYVHQRRPGAKVLIVPPALLKSELGRFGPHLVVSSETAGDVRGAVHSWVEILIHDGMGANVSVDDMEVRKIEDVGMDDILGVLDETERLLGLGASPELV